MIARIMELPLVGSYHTELGAYAGLRSGDVRLRAGIAAALAAFYGRCDVVLSPSASADESLCALGIDPGRIGRWDRGVDLGRFHPATPREGSVGGEVNVLYAGRLTSEKGIDLLIDAFEEARALDPRLHLVLAGGGPEEGVGRDRLGRHATFLGWLEGHELACAYSSADVFLFPSSTDTFGQVIIEAQASGLPVVAVGKGGPLSLVEDGRSGLLRAAEPAELARAVVEVVRSPVLRDRLILGGLAAARSRSWEAALGRLAEGYGRALALAPRAGRGLGGAAASHRRAV